MNDSKLSFAFAVLSYNHQDYIIEHLESIKYLVEQYGQGMAFQIIINDDASKDGTVALADAWLEKNAHLFAKIDKLYNKNNLGTCKSVCNVVDALQSSYCKITAGDDVYSWENLFSLIPSLNEFDIASGLPLDLTDGRISKNNSDIFHLLASACIYENDLLINRLKGISVNNAPSIIYRAEHLKNKDIMAFVAGFDVVEDWPLQIAIAEAAPISRLGTVPTVFVYYRRTAGSTYLVASSRFYKDQVKVFEYLIAREPSFIGRWVLRNRLLCFKSGSRLVKRLFNAAVFIYGLKCLLSFFSIRKQVQVFEVDVDRHGRYYADVKHRAFEFVQSIRPDGQASS